MSDPNRYSELDAILSALCDAQLQPQQKMRFREILRSDAQARAFYRDYIAMHIGLEFRYGSLVSPQIDVPETHELFDAAERYGTNKDSKYPFSDAMVLPSLPESIDRDPDPSQFQRWPARVRHVPRQSIARTLLRSRVIWAAAASLIVGVASLPLFLGEPKVGPPPPPPLVAKFGKRFHAVWNVILPADGRLRKGEHFALLDGYAEVVLFTGPKIIVQGPADFCVDSPHSIELISGRIAATAIGGGFRVNTPTAVITDLGTEFGISVGPDYATRVDVFKGEVTAGDAKGVNAAQLVSAGGAADVVRTGVNVNPSGAQPQTFVRSLDGIVVRGRLIVELRPDLNAGDTTWVNHAGDDSNIGDFAEVDGGGVEKPLTIDSINGPTGITFNALHLGERQTRYLVSRKDVPEELTSDHSVSIEAWIRSTSKPGEFEAVASWGRFDLGTERNFLFGTSTPFAGYYADLPDWGGSEPRDDHWHYVGWVYDSSSHVMTVYVDGKKTVAGKVDLHTTVSRLILGAMPGSAGGKDFTTIPLNGYLGALRIETGVLSEQDIERNFRRGLDG